MPLAAGPPTYRKYVEGVTHLGEILGLVWVKFTRHGRAWRMTFGDKVKRRAYLGSKYTGGQVI